MSSHALRPAGLCLLAAGLCAALACGGGEGLGGLPTPADAGAGAGDAGARDAGPSDAGATDAGPPDAGATDAGPSDAGAADAGASDAGPSDAGEVPDPLLPGPCTTAVLDLKLVAPATSDNVPLHVTYPVSCPQPGPFPAVVVAHGFLLPVAQYAGTALHLARFGYVVATADYPSSLFSPNHAHAALDLLAALDALAAAGRDPASPLHGLVAPGRAGLVGHSLGGKVALLAAARDARVGAVVGFDPVDSSSNCSAQDCPPARGVLPLAIPLAYLGETLDSGGSNACAPASANYQVLYAASAPPALEVTLTGAGHVSFLDDPSTCGFACSVCKTPTAPHDQVLGIARAVAVAFLGRWLKGEAGFDTDLGGARAQARWASTGKAAFTAR